MVGESPDDSVLDCYSLARAYHQSPEHFLAMRISEVRLHVLRTQQLMAELRQDQTDGD